MTSKVLLLLAAFIGWGFISMWWWRSSVLCACIPAESTANVTPIDSIAATSALPYFFRGKNDSKLHFSSSFPAYLDSLKAISVSGDRFLVKGYWYANEDTSGIGDLGLSRAGKLKDALSRYFDPSRIDIVSQFINSPGPEPVYRGAVVNKIIKQGVHTDSTSSVIHNGKLLVYFPSNSAKNIFDRQTEKNIMEIIRMAAAGGKQILITGYTDSEGNDHRNMILGLNRANKLKVILTGRGVKADQIKILSKGETMPAATNKTAAGRAINRRAELTIEP